MNSYPRFLPRPTPQQLAYQRTETNLFIHFGVNTFSDREWGDGSESPAIFNPTKLDCTQWAQAARKGGFQVAILTAKHHDGFCLWPSAETDHSVQSSPWKSGRGDVVREFVDAFRSEGIKVGLYLSPWDRHEKSYGSAAYNDFYCRQLTELLTQYGELHEVWFDGACAEGPNGRRQEYDWDRFFALVKKLQPGAVTFGDGGTDVRWVGNERGMAGETCWSTVDPDVIRFPGDSGIAQPTEAVALGEKSVLNVGHIPDGSRKVVWRPAECDVSIRPGWFHHRADDEHVRSVDNLVELYFQSVGRNSTLLLNIPPTPEGLFYDRDVDNIAGFRRELQRLFAINLALKSQPTASSEVALHPAAHLIDGDANTYWSATKEASEAVIELEWSEPQTLGIACLQEPIQFGQQIEAYRIEAQTDNEDWSTIARGTTIGYKKLDRLDGVITRRVRLVIERSLGTPRLAHLAFYAR